MKRLLRCVGAWPLQVALCVALSVGVASCAQQGEGQVMDGDVDLKEIGEEFVEEMFDPDAAYTDGYIDSVRELPDVQLDESGLLYQIERMGEGAQPGPESFVRVHYYGRFTDGALLDSSRRGEPLVFPLQSVIPGWVIGLQKIREGGKIRLHIPPYLAYGDEERPGVPANSTLVFDVTLERVLTQQEAEAEMQRAQQAQ